MQRLIIKGNKKLSGVIKISGSKNATLPILAASILPTAVNANIMVRDALNNADKLFKLLEILEDNDDVQVVSSNFEVDDAVMSHLTS